jgi:hypothetical protein
MRSALIGRGKRFKPDPSSNNGGELTRAISLSKKTVACAVSTPLIGGGVAEWLKAAVC